MRKEGTIRQKLTPYFLLATGIPIALFAMVSQYRLYLSLEENLENQIAVNLNHADRHLDMVLDKYNTLLYDFSMDEDVIALVEQIDRSEGNPDANSRNIREELSHICNRNSGVLGITIFTEHNKIIYYDRTSASMLYSTWADQVDNPDVERGTIYQGGIQPITVADKSVYPFRIARKLGDYGDIGRTSGKVVLTMNETVLKEAMKSSNETNYLIQDGIVISAFDSDKIGKSIDSLGERQYLTNEICNKTSGLLIRNEQSLEAYRQTFFGQGMFWVLIALATTGVTLALSYILTRPYLKEIDTMAKAMSEVEQGNFKVQLPVSDHMSTEIREISTGFNAMVSRIDVLIEQVKSAILEQRHAELSALEAQIDPHFLYNTLDAINWKAIEKGEFEISGMLGGLADILRYAVKNAGEQTSIEQELYWLHQYMLLQSTKAGKVLQITVDVAEELKGYRIHKLLLQPFVENAIKHGMRGKEGACNIDISMRRIGPQIRIRIKDNGCGMDEDVLDYINGFKEEDIEYEKVHLGLVNVRKRLSLYYGEQADLYFESEVGCYTRVHLFIPVIDKEDEVSV